MKNDRVNNDSDGPETPAWMVTYSDVVTLLMTFFVLLMTFSTVDEDDFARAMGIFTGYAGVAGPGTTDKDSYMGTISLAGRIHEQGLETMPEYDPLELVEGDLKMRIQAAGLGDVVELNRIREGVVLRIGSGPVFQYASVRFLPERIALLNTIGETLRYAPHRIEVMGHCDRYFVPTGAYPTGSDMALARAAVACDHLSSVCHIAPDRLSAACAAAQGPSAGEGDLVIIVHAQPKKEIRL